MSLIQRKKIKNGIINDQLIDVLVFNLIKSYLNCITIYKVYIN
jgi:hypothetical protein